MFGFGRNRRRRRAEEEALRRAARKREAAESHRRITHATFRDEGEYYHQARRRAQRIAATNPRGMAAGRTAGSNPALPVLSDHSDQVHGPSDSSHDSGSSYGGHSPSGHDGGSSSSGGGFDGGGGGF